MPADLNEDLDQALEETLWLVSHGIFETCPPAILKRVERLDRLMDMAYGLSRIKTFWALSEAQYKTILAHYRQD